MSKICTYCGGMAKKGGNFCPYCGRPLPEDPVHTATPLRTNGTFSQIKADKINIDESENTTTASRERTSSGGNNRNNNATEKWKKKFGYRVKDDEGMQKMGIILTNTRDLHDDGYFKFILNKYVEKRLADDVNYVILDFNDFDYDDELSCELIVELLRAVYEEIVPHYLMIVGDYTVIPCMEWKNEGKDKDKTVPSDLPYITLDTDSPWDGTKYSFEDITSVGRIPTSPQNNFEEAINYFKNAMDFEVCEQVKGLAYSAYQWKLTSKNCFSSIAPTVLTSPNYTSNKAIAEKYGLIYFDDSAQGKNLLCFNLHGSSVSHVWSGQYNQSFPEAFKADLLPKDVNGYVVCTEACYGARPQIYPKKEKGIVVRALENNCIAFVGSTRIAYGLDNGYMSCADIIANVFAKKVAGGATVGSAFLCSLEELCKTKMNETVIKTMAEFALYGDPSLRLIGDKYKTVSKDVGKVNVCKAEKNEKNAVRLMLCDENMQISQKGKGGNGIDLMSFSSHNTQDIMQIKKMVHNATESSKNYVLMNYSEFSDVKPEIYKVVGKDGYRAIYTKEDGDIVNIIKVYMNDKGEVEETYISK